MFTDLSSVSLKSKRLNLQPIKLSDSEFIYQLVNNPDWIQFIGDRKIKTQTDALIYLQNIIQKENLVYFVIRLQETQESIGIISFMQRPNLAYPDIGFALLPEYYQLGIAFEASKCLINKLSEMKFVSEVLAITQYNNLASIRLLEKLHFIFNHSYIENDIEIFVYSKKL